MTPAEGPAHLPSCKDSGGSARTLGLGVFSGSYFLRHVTFVSTEAPSPAAGATGRGPHAAHKACLILPDCQHSGGTPLPCQDRQLGGKGGDGGADPRLHPPRRFLFLEHLARGEKSVPKELFLCLTINAHSYQTLYFSLEGKDSRTNCH